MFWSQKPSSRDKMERGYAKDGPYRLLVGRQVRNPIFPSLFVEYKVVYIYDTINYATYLLVFEKGTTSAIRNYLHVVTRYSTMEEWDDGRNKLY